MELRAGIQLTQIEDGYSCYLDNQGDMMGVGNNRIYDDESGEVEPMQFASRFVLLCGNDKQELTDLQLVSITPQTDKLTVTTDFKTGNIGITAQPGLDFTHAGCEYKIRFKATCYGLTRGHSDDPTYLSAEFILQGVPEAADGVSYRLSLSDTFIAKDGHGEYKNPDQTITANVIYAKSNGELSVMTAAEMKELGLTLDYAIDGTAANGSATQTPPLTIVGIGKTVKVNKALTVRLWHGDKQVDGQDIFVVKDGADNVRIDLDNENDSMLYNGQGVKASADIVSHVSMWDGSEDVTSQSTFSIVADGCTATLSGSTITVTALSKNNASVKVTGRYRDQDYSTVLTLSKKNNTDKYDLAITPNAIAYNTTTQKASSDKITVQVYRTYIDTNGSAKTVLCDTLPTGFSLKEGGSAVTYKGGKYERTPLDYTKGDYRYDIINKDGGVEDYETIPINKTTNLTIETLDTKYGISASADTKPTKWQEDVPVVPQGQYLWSWTHIKYSDGTEDDTYSRSYQSSDLYTVDLTNEMSAVPCDEDSHPYSNKTVKTSVLYYKGAVFENFRITNIIKSEGIDCDVEPSATTVYNAEKQLTFTVTKQATLPQDISIVCADANGEHSHAATLTIVGVPGTASYELVVSTPQVIYNPNKADNAYTPATASITSLTKEENGSISQVTKVPAGYRLWYGTNGETPTQSVAADGNVTTAALAPGNTTRSIDFYLCANTSETFSDANVVDKERVWVVTDGVDGKNLTNVINYYKWGTSGTTAPTGDYTENEIPAHVDGTDYLWNYEVCYNNKSEAISTSGKTCIGYFPKGIGEFSEVYQRTSTADAPAAPTLSADKKTITYGNWGTDIVATDKDNRYLWNCEIVKYSDGTYYIGIPHTAGVQGEGLSVDEKYGVSNNETTVPANWVTLDAAKSSWGENNRYLWNQETISVGGTAQTPTAHIIAIWTKDGKEIVSYTETYCASSSGTTQPNDSLFVSRTDAMSDISDAKPYLWNKEVVTYNDDTTDTKYHVIAIKGTDGTSPYVIDLSNEMVAIAIDSVGHPVKQRSVSTKVSFYMGSTFRKFYITAIALPHGITCNTTASDRTEYSEAKQLIFSVSPDADLSSPTQIAITCVDALDNTVSRTVAMTLTGIPGTVTYDLLLSANQVVYNPNASSNNFTPASVSVTALIKSESGKDDVPVSVVPTGYVLWRGVNDGTPVQRIPQGNQTSQAAGAFSSTITSNDFYLCYDPDQSDRFDASKVVDKERVLRVTGGRDGKDAINADLDNEMDSILYDGMGTKVSADVTSRVTLYKGGTVVAQAFSIEEANDVTATIDETGHVITVSDVTAAMGNVKVSTTYNGVTYSAVFSVARKTEGDKYDFIVSPNEVSYNATTGEATSNRIMVYVQRTHIGEDGKPVSEILEKLPEGFVLRMNSVDKTSSYEHHRLLHNIDFATETSLRFDLLNADGGTEDYETVPINKVSDGDEGRGIVSQVMRYLVNSDPNNAPEFTDQSPTSSPATTDENPYLWRQTVITYNRADANGNTTETFVEVIGVHGQRGIDGDAEDYIYCRTKTETTATQLPTFPAAPLTTNNASTDSQLKWTDDPQGVNKTWQYEYVAVAHKRNGVWESYGDVSLHNTYVEDGDDALVATLSPASANFPVDKDNKTTSAQSLTATLNITSGADLQKITSVKATGIPTNCTLKVGNAEARANTAVTTNSTSLTLTFGLNNGTAFSSTQQWTIEATCGLGTRTVKFSATPSKEGKTGDSGTSPVAVDIDNEMTSVACNTAGKPTAATSVETTAYLYVGSTKKTVSSITTSTLPTGITQDTNTSLPKIKFDIATSCDLSQSKEITLTISDGTYSGTAVMTINGVKPGPDGKPAVIYEIITNPTQVVVPKNGTALGNPTPNTITATILKTEGDSSSSLAGNETDSNKVQLKYKKDSATNWTDYPSSGGINVSKTDKYVTFELYKYNTSTVIDRETVPLVKDGVNGAASTVAGPPGLQGCIVRNRGKWYKDSTYYNDSTLDAPRDGLTIRYIDVVWTQEQEVEKPKYWRLLDYVTLNKGTDPTKDSNKEVWTGTEWADLIATKVLIADSADMEVLSSGSVVVKCGQNHVTGGMSGGTDTDGVHTGTAFWAGADASHMSTAPFNVDHQGNLNTTKINATGGKIGGFTIYGTSIGTGTYNATDPHSALYLGENIMQMADGKNKVAIGLNTQSATYGWPQHSIIEHTDGSVDKAIGTRYNIENTNDNIAIQVDAGKCKMRGLHMNYAVKDSSYTATTEDDVIVFKTPAGGGYSNPTLTLPKASGCPGKVYYVRSRHRNYNVQCSTNGVFIDDAASATTDPAERPRHAAIYFNDGVYWYEVWG